MLDIYKNKRFDKNGVRQRQFKVIFLVICNQMLLDILF